MNFLKNNLSKMLITSIFLLFFLITISSVNAVNITLNPSDSGGINSAISSIASVSDTNNSITLNPGTYNKTTDRNSEITFNDKNLTIQGNGSKDSIIIDAQKMGRMFTISGNSNITFINITFINGNENYGGTIHNTQSKITINNCTFTNNTARNDIATAFGGAIYNTGNLTVTSCNFTNNTVESKSSSAAYGGAIYNNGILRVIGCKFTNNTAINVAFVGGGAIYNYKGTCTVTGCNFINNIVTSTSNSAIATSGAMFNAGNLTVTGCTFINNTVKLPDNYAAYGGAIYNEPNAIITVTGCNFTNNTIISSATGFGGAIFSGGNCTITGCNIINNSHGIYISSGIANINYNRIFNNTNYDLKTTTNINADFNWWGSNSPDMSKIIGITLANYFVMYVVNLTSLDSNGAVLFNCSFKLNDTGVFDIGNLPFFETYVETNLTTGIIGYFNVFQPFNISINNLGAIKYIFTTDNEVQSLLGTIKLETNSTVVAPNTKLGQSTNITGVAIDENGAPIANTVITVNINGVTSNIQTNGLGEWNLLYTPNTNGSFNVILSWNGNATHNGFTNQTTFKVDNIISTNSTVVAPDTILGQSSNLHGVAIDENGAPIANTVITVNINGVTSNIQTNGLGEWNLLYTPNTNGSFNVILSWNGNATHSGFINTASFIVAQINSTNPIVPLKTSSSLSLFLDKPYGYGYLVGEVATVTWVTTGIANLNQRAMIQFIENGKIWHTQYVLLSDGKYLHKFIMSHKTLDVVMIFLGDSDSYGSSDKVPTYVDPVNNRRTFVEIQNMSNLTVGKKGYIDIIVKDYKGEIIKKGKVILKFDNKWSFTVNIKNGLAKFSKIFTKSGNNRTLKITYIKDDNNTASSISTNIVVNKK